MRRAVAALVLGICCGGSLFAQAPDWSKIEIKSQELGPGIYMLQGAGGNIGLSVGDDGAVLIDDQFAPLSDKIKAAIAAVTSKPVRFVVNTHWHGDHTGGNEWLGKAGVVIVAHDNVRKRMSVEQVDELWGRTTPPSPAPALPILTFSEDVTLHVNGRDLHVVHFPPAHTDGDAIVEFVGADVIHAGDLFFNGRYPVVDVSSGATITGMIAACDRLLGMAGPSTKIIPGHGPLGGVTELRAFHDMLVQAKTRLAPLVAAGQSADDLVKAKPLADLDAVWGQGGMTPERFLRAAHMSLKRETAPR
jgi:cyclase